MWEVLVGDCIEHMRGLPANSVDCVVTDPPYQQTSLKWDRWVAGWMDEVDRVLKPSGSVWVFGSLRMFMDRRDEFDGWKMAQDVVWEKHNGSSFHTDRFRRVHEQAVQFYRGKWGDVFKAPQMTMDDRPKVVRRKERPPHMGAIEGSTYVSQDGGPRLQRSVIFARSEHGRAVHPTQKPVEIVEPLVLSSCPLGGTVLDPFGGSGTTAGVAVKHGRRAILCELNPEYAALVPARVEKIAGPSIFA